MTLLQNKNLERLIYRGPNNLPVIRLLDRIWMKMSLFCCEVSSTEETSSTHKHIIHPFPFHPVSRHHDTRARAPVDPAPGPSKRAPPPSDSTSVSERTAEVIHGFQPGCQALVLLQPRLVSAIPGKHRNAEEVSERELLVISLSE